jgi:hypothetical protein
MLVSAVIKQAMRSAGVLDANQEPRPSESEAALAALNGLQLSLFGNEVGLPLDAVSLTGSLTGEFGAMYQCKLSAAATLTFPNNPQDGARIGFIDVGGNFNTYNLTVNPNNRKIATAIGTYATANQTMSAANVSKTYFFRSDAGWTEETSWALTDTPYFPEIYHTALADILALVLAPQYSNDPTNHLVVNAQRGRDILMNRYNPRQALAKARGNKVA